MPKFWESRENLFGAVLWLTLGAVVFELAATFSYRILDLLLILLAILFLVSAIDHLRPDRPGAMAELFGRLGGRWIAVALLAAYLLYDLISLLWSPAPAYGMSKYKVVVLMVFLSACILLYVDSVPKLRALLLSLGVASGATAAFSIVNYLLAGPFPVRYTLRLTLRSDYNVFATTLLLGVLCAVYLFATAKFTVMRCILFVLDLGVTLTVLYLSASRRVFLMLPPILLFWLCVLLFRQKSWRELVTAIGVILAAGLLFWGGVWAMQNQMRARYEKYGSFGFGQGSAGGTGSTEGSAMDRYETVTEGGLLQKRGLIWGIAWEDYQQFSLTEKLFGRGFGYDIVLYDEVENDELAQEYAHLDGQKGLLSAHSFLLADLLNGGIVKAVLGLALMLALAWDCIVLCRRSFPAGALMGNALAVVALGSLVSNRFGLLYDKFFWLFALFLLLALGLPIRQEPHQRRVFS